MPNDQQVALFSESIEDAIREAVRVLGGSKAVGSQLRPEMLADKASTWLSDCLNTDRRDKLDLNQMMWILRAARKAGYHGAINYICADIGYSNPLPVEPEDEKARLMREFIEATKQQTRNVARMEELSRPSIRSAA